jgi:hypothetical protein
MTNAELTEVRCAITMLRTCVETLRIATGDSPAIRRLLHDVDRLQLDMEDAVVPATHAARVSRMTSVTAMPTVPSKATPLISAQALPQEIVPISEGPYDRILWHGADDEGIGGNRR